MIVGFNATPIAGIADLHKVLLGHEIVVRSELTVLRHTQKLLRPVIPREFTPAGRELAPRQP